MPIIGKIMLSASANEFVCVSCSGNYGMSVPRREFNSLKIINNSTWDNLKSIKMQDELVKSCLNILKYDVQNVFNHKFNTF